MFNLFSSIRLSDHSWSFIQFWALLLLIDPERWLNYSDLILTVWISACVRMKGQILCSIRIFIDALDFAFQFGSWILSLAFIGKMIP
mgnify:CR=1